MTTRAPQMPVFDPFFDSNGDANVRTPGPLTPQSAPVPGAEYYRTPNSVVMSNGRSAQELMRPGVQGLQGVVVPHATLGGIPAGMRPHNIREMEINVDPHIIGQNAIVRLSDVTPSSIQRANRLAAQATPEPIDMATMRLRGSAAMHGIVAGAQVNGGASRNGVPPQTAAPASFLPSPNLARVATSQQQRRSSPLQSFLHGTNTSAETAQYGRELRAIDLDSPSVVSPPPRSLAEPQYEVIFQLQAFGEHRAYFHDVVIGEGFLVLVYKLGFRGSKWFPPVAPNADAPPLALNVAGTETAYLVHTTGVQYVYEGAEHCVLMIERTAQLDEPPQEE